MEHKRKKIIGFVGIILIIGIILTCQVFEKINTKNKKLDEMAINASYEYLINIKNENIEDILKSKIFGSENEKVNKKFTLKHIKELNDYLLLKEVSNEVIKKNLHIIKMRDKNLKVNKAFSIVQHLYPEFKNKRMNAKNTRVVCCATIASDNGMPRLRTILLLPYYQEDKMIFFDVFNNVSLRYAATSYDPNFPSAEMNIHYLDYMIFYRFEKNYVVNVITGEKFKSY